MTLCLAPDLPSPFLAKVLPAPLLHLPVIEIVPRSRADLEISEARERVSTFTHAILTSRTAARLAGQFGLLSPQQHILAIGEGTAQVLQGKGYKVILAQSPTQEGIIATLQPLNVQEMRILLPTAEVTRDVLTSFLSQERVHFEQIALYRTRVREDVLELPVGIKAIYFSSPSTVRGFIQHFGKPAPEILLYVIGPVTAKALAALLPGAQAHRLIAND